MPYLKCLGRHNILSSPTFLVVQCALPTLWYTSINSAAAIYIAEETDEKFGGLPPPICGFTYSEALLSRLMYTYNALDRYLQGLTKSWGPSLCEYLVEKLHSLHFLLAGKLMV